MRWHCFSTRLVDLNVYIVASDLFSWCVRSLEILESFQHDLKRRFRSNHGVWIVCVFVSARPRSQVAVIIERFQNFESN